MRKQFSKSKYNNLSKYTRKQVWNTTIRGSYNKKKLAKTVRPLFFFPESPSCQTMTEGVHIIIRYPVRKSNVTFPFQKYSKRKFSQKKNGAAAIFGPSSSPSRISIPEKMTIFFLRPIKFQWFRFRRQTRKIYGASCCDPRLIMADRI